MPACASALETETVTATSSKGVVAGFAQGDGDAKRGPILEPRERARGRRYTENRAIFSRSHFYHSDNRIFSNN